MKNILLLVSFLCTLAAHAQYQELESVQVGSEFRGKGKWNNIKFNVVSDKGEIYSVSKRSGRGSRMVIDVFNAQMEHQKQFYIKGEKEDQFVAGDFIDGELKFVSFDREHGKAILYRVDIVNEKFIEEKTIFDFSDKKLEKYTARASSGFFGSNRNVVGDVDSGGFFRRSSTGSFYLFALDIKTGRVGTEEHEVVVLNDRFETHFTTNYKDPVKDKLLSIRSFSINEQDGSVMMTTQAFENGKRKKANRKSRKKADANYHLELILLNKSGTFKYSFGDEKFFIENVASATRNGKYVIGGYYSKDKALGQEGVYMGLFDEQLTPISSTLQPFSDEFISEMHGSASEKRTKRKKKKQSSRLEAHQILLDNMDNAYLVGEEQYITWVTSGGMNGAVTSSPIFHFEDIAVAKFNAEGKMVSNKLVRKTQFTSGRKNDIYSYYAFLNNGRLNLFFNASELNESRSDISLTFSDKRESKLALINVQMDDTGEMVFKEVISSDNSSYAMSIRNARRLNDNSFIMDGNNGKTKRFAKVSL